MNKVHITVTTHHFQCMRICLLRAELQLTESLNPTKIIKLVVKIVTYNNIFNLLTWSNALAMYVTRIAPNLPVRVTAGLNTSVEEKGKVNKEEKREMWG